MRKEEKLWFDPGYTIRKKIDIDTKAAAITDPIGTSAVLVRLHEGVMSFMSAKKTAAISASPPTIIKPCSNTTSRNGLAAQ